MKRKFGDRKDGVLIRKTDAFHLVMPIIWPNRCDNIVFNSDILDLTKTMAYLEKKNAQNSKYKHTIFHVIVAATLKMITLRPKLNYFIANKNMYARNEITASFVVKKQFTDDGEEGMVRIHAEKTDTYDTIHNKISEAVIKERSNADLESTEKFMDILNKLPRCVVKVLGGFLVFLDKHGRVPQSITETDPYYASVIFTNVGSIQIPNGYHHLTNWGTTSFFITVGGITKRPYFHDDGKYNLRDTIELGLTFDERIFDGYYFSRSLKMMNTFIENPELLELPFSEETENGEPVS